MKARYLIIMVFAVALSVIILTGAFYSYWENVSTLPNANVSVDVVYAYIGQSLVSNDTLGLNYAASNLSANYSLASYVVVLNVTNKGSELVSLTQFRAFVAKQITEYAVGLNNSSSGSESNSLDGSSYKVTNALISDVRAGLPTSNFSNYIDAGASQLIALSGVVTLDKLSEQYLKDGSLWVWASVTAETGYASGQSLWSSNSQTSNDLKQVTFKDTGGAYLYNNLLSYNQTLVINGLDGEVVLNT